MSQEDRRHEIARKKVVYRMPAMDVATVRRDEVFPAADGEALAMDLYHPPDRKSEAPPAVLFVMGYRDAGSQRILGCRAKEMESFIGWARLTAASGMAAVAYTTGADPVADARAALRHLRQRAGDLGIDAARIGLWACSGHVPNALSLLGEEKESLKCAALFYGYLLDLDGTSAVAEGSRAFGFVNPGAGQSVADLPRDTPLFIARAGRDEMPGLNGTIDRFIAAALAGNLPVTLVNLPDAPHAFDIVDDRESSREAIRQSLAFLRFHLSALD
jgi:acetyl esterase/lipase